MKRSWEDRGSEIDGRMILPRLTQAGPKVLQGTMQVHLERSLAASGGGGRLRQGAILQEEMLDGLALAQGQLRNRLGDGAAWLAMGHLRFVGMALVGERRMQLARTMPAGLAHEVDRATLGNDLEPGCE